MITTTELSIAWDSISPHQGDNIGRRADTSHPLDFFIGYDERSNMQLMLLSNFMPELPKSSQQIIVRGNKRVDGDYALCFSLVEKELRDLYVSLCWDMMDCTVEIHEKRRGTLAALKRFRMWQKLFAEIKNKTLSEFKVKGLIGELCVLKQICAPIYGLAKSVQGWAGPLGADRDFEFDDAWYESKAVSLSKESITISSLDQLDIDSPGYLILCRVEKTSEQDPNAISLKRLINNVCTELGTDERTVTIFKNKLALSNYQETDELVETSYVLYRIEKYVVNSSFPRIRRCNVESAVTNGTYDLSIAAIHQWQTK